MNTCSSSIFLLIYIYVIKTSKHFHTTVPYLKYFHDGYKDNTETYVSCNSISKPYLNNSVIKIPVQSKYRQAKIQLQCVTAECLITVTKSTSPPQPWIKGVSICYY